MAKLTLTDARNLMLKGKPWTFRMEFQGPNPNNKSGWSTKFWLATGRGFTEPVEIHFGTIGAIGGVGSTLLVRDWSYVEAKAPEKEAKGYHYADTPFVRVQPSTIAQAVPQSAVVPVPKAPVTSPVTPAIFPQSPPKPSTINPLPVTLVAAALKLPGPWGKIRVVTKLVDGWWGLDATGTKVLQMTKDGARDLVRAQPHIQVQGL